MTLDDFIARARQGQATPTVYFLGKGGWHKSEAASPTPGRPIDLAMELRQMQAARPKVHAKYMEGMAQARLQVQDLPRLACDCSGYVCWALGQPRDGSVLPDKWISTDSIWNDARTRNLLFKPLTRAVPGALLVYPKPGDADDSPGHVGIVVEADADGRATRVLHCAPENYLIPPADGAPRNAIAETDTAHFDAMPTTMLVMWKGFD